MKTLINKADKYSMNWIEGAAEWGTVKAPKNIFVEIKQSEENGIITEEYRFTNTAAYDIFTSLKDISIYTPFNDDYAGAEICVKQRCHTHIWCGGQISYVMALRMGGEAPHLGLVLTKGSLGGYSVERDLSRISNDRGDFLLHPSPVALAPRESFTIEWKLFWHEGKEDFRKKLLAYNPSYIEINSKQYTWFANEEVEFQILPNFKIENSEIKKNSKNVSFIQEGNILKVKDPSAAIGENRYEITINGIKTFCRMLVLPCFQELIKKRCDFISENQQYHNAKSHLDGAFLIYDNEEKHCYYNPKNDYDAGRERVGMGILLANYLKQYKNQELTNALKKYVNFLERELVDTESGTVFNDYQRNDTYKRLYNYPWVSLLYLELTELFNSTDYLCKAYRVLRSFYEHGGASFYVIEVPLEKILKALKEAKLDKEYEELLAYFRLHCETILENGIFYPPHEVKFEQSIVAPAADLLLQMYSVTREEKYLKGGEQQLRILELFNSEQPDYHMHEVSIRHWDGYWFGKKKLYGDTYPHYWSALTGNVYLRYARLTDNEKYKEKGERSLRGVLSLFHTDGTASCAFVYPVSVNGETASYYDAYANDQDWGLYFNSRAQTSIDN